MTTKCNSCEKLTDMDESKNILACLKTALPHVEKAREAFSVNPQCASYLLLSCALNDIMAVASEERRGQKAGLGKRGTNEGEGSLKDFFEMPGVSPRA